MVAVQAGEDEVLPELERFGGSVCLAAVNTPGSLVLSGDEDAVLELAGVWEERGRKTKRLGVSHAFHSARMDGMLAEFKSVLEGMSFSEPQLPIISNLTGQPATSEICTPEYWVSHARSTVRFAEGVRWLEGQGVNKYLELGPDGTLSAITQENHDATPPVVVTPVLREDHPENETLLEALAHAWVSGVNIDWNTIFHGTGAKRIELPTYAFQRQHYWLKPTLERVTDDHIARGMVESVEGGFWKAVEQEDADCLADVLGLEGEDRVSPLGNVLPMLSAWRRDRAMASIVDNWRYRIGWSAVTGDSTGLLSGTWLVVVGVVDFADGVASDVISALGSHGAEVVVMEVIPGMDRDGLAELISGALANATNSEAGVGDEESVNSARVDALPVNGVLSLLALDEARDSRYEAVPQGLAGTLLLMQALGDLDVEAPLWLGTVGAVLVASSDSLENPQQGMVWGLGRVLGLEHAGRWGGLIDLPRTFDERVAQRLCRVCSGLCEENQLALRPAGIFARRLVRMSGGGGTVARKWRPRGTVLLTGGTGALGRYIAGWLAENGAEHILLVSRSGSQAPGVTELERGLIERGSRVTVMACDVADRKQIESVLAEVPEEYPLEAIIHAAGVLDDGPLDGLTVERLGEVLASKVDGALNLHELSAGMDLSAFVLFSSIAGTLGAGRQPAYATANAYLTSLAQHRHALGLAATSVAWGAGGGEGMTEGYNEQLLRRGIREMAPELAIGALQQALDLGEPCLTIADIDWKRYAVSYSSARARPLICEVSEARDALERMELASEEQASGEDLATRLAGLPQEEREAVMLELVRLHTAGVLGHATPDTVEAGRAFKDLGLDSLAAVELRNRLNAAVGIRLPTAVVFDYPSPTDLAAYLLNEVAGVESQGVLVSVSRASVSEDPIAIVGMACRYPGGIRSPGDLWELVGRGEDAISHFPADRGWNVDGAHNQDPENADVRITGEGGFLYDAGNFDAAFFAISPREALSMDPQQRLLLEACWEALEDGGIDPHSLRGSQTGIFTGISSYHYGLDSRTGIDGTEGYRMTGGACSVASGRVAYTFGLEGPAISLDTACSSSLVALHLACQALRADECSLALVGGVTVMADPSVFEEFARQGGLAVDGRCKSFGDGADGTGWGEGGGVVVVERLSDAVRNGHSVLGVVRGSAVNQDGASNGLTAPNGPSQQRVILQALANAGLVPGEVDVVEAHGTGTALGDPIEAQALLATYGQDRPEGSPLWLGSVKSNIGHTQAAAGMAGVIKMLMAMRHGVLPRTLHARTRSSQIDWSSGAVELLGEEVPWESSRPRRAGVSSFGISGTNAHVIIEEPPVVGGALGDDPGVGVVDGVVGGVGLGVVPWVLSGRGEGGLVGQAGRLREFVSTTVDADGGGGVGVLDVGLSLVGRSVFERRGVVLGGGREGLLDGLSVLAGSDNGGGVGRGVVSGVVSPGALAFLFTGQGSQRVGMGRGLWDEFPVFRDALGEVCGHFDVLLGYSLRDVMFGTETGIEGSGVEGGVGGLGLGHTSLAQAGLFALEVGLFRLLEALGVRPDYLLGHSVGEIVAAHVAGVFSLGDACRIVEARGRLMGALPTGGVMVAVQAGEDEVLPELERFGGSVCLAAVNTPGSLVLSGDEDAVLELAGVWEERGRKTKRLGVSHAFHSARMDGMLAEFKSVLEGVSFSEPQLPIISNLTGQPATSEICTPEYWVSHARSTVRFGEGVRWLEGQGVNKYLELGPDGTLSAITQENHDATPPVVVTPVLREDHPENETLLEALAHAWVSGVNMDWNTIFQGTGAKRVGLPAYAFQRERYWLESARGVNDLASVGQGAAEHPLLGAVVGLAGDGWLFTGRLSLQNDPWLADHVVFGHVVLAGTVFLELVLCAGREIGCEGIGELTLHAPLVLPEHGGVQIQVRVGEPEQTGDRQVTVSSRPDDNTEKPDESWTTHAQGTLTTNTNQTHNHDDHTTINTQEWPPTGSETVDIEGFYDRLADIGLEYGPAFQALRAVWRDDSDLYAEVALPAGLEGQAESVWGHPVLLESALHAVVAGFTA